MDPARVADYFAAWSRAVPESLHGDFALWLAAEFPVDEAAEWAHQGFTCAQAEQLAAVGLSPTEARAAWDTIDFIEATTPGLSKDQKARRAVAMLNGTLPADHEA